MPVPKQRFQMAWTYSVLFYGPFAQGFQSFGTAQILWVGNRLVASLVHTQLESLVPSHSVVQGILLDNLRVRSNDHRLPQILQGQAWPNQQKPGSGNCT